MEAMGISTGGAERGFLTPIPSGMSTQSAAWSSIRYLPRANYESFRSQRFFGYGRALLPPDPTAFIDLMVDETSLQPGAAVTETGGILAVPSGYAAVITGFRQWVGDANAFNKPSGSPDDLVWRITAAATPIFLQGNIPAVFSTLANEAKEFAIVTESTAISVGVQNRVSPSDPLARSIPVAALITGHWFPMDELDDIFRNR
jgi:hypothetical protein